MSKNQNNLLVFLSGLLVFLIIPDLSDAGVGGIAGGSDPKSISARRYAGAYATGGSVLFQESSTFVNPAYNKTLCLNSKDQYEAVFLTCTKWVKDNGERVCVRKGKKKFYQNRISIRSRCETYESGECVSWDHETVFNQSRTRYIEYRNSSDDVVGTDKLTISRCRK